MSGNSARTEKEFIQLVKEKESAKQAAHITQVFLKNITESLPQFVFWKDINSIYLGCNKNYAQLLGLNSPEEIIGKTDYDLSWQSTGHTAEIFQKGDQDTIAGRLITNQEETLALPNGKTIITLVSKLPIIDNGKVIGIVGYFTDITEIKNKEQELIKARQEAEAANHAKSTFIANISHDIRTPLTGMIGMARLMSKKLESTQEKEAANNLFNAGNILLGLLNEVIEIVKLDSGALPVYEMKFSLSSLINDLVSLFTPSTQEKNLKLVARCDDAIPDYLIGDQTRIHRVLLNLVGNALKFTDHGEISLIANLVKRKAREVVIKISVSDTGMGIAPDKQQIIFSRFTRLNPAYTGNYHGFGLGLSIVKQLITEINGEVYVDSKEGQGSIFTCILPLKEALLDTSEGKINIGINNALSPEPYKLPILMDNQPLEGISEKRLAHHKKVLLVEDNKLAQIVAKDLLEDFHYHVDVAGTAEEAIILFKNNQYGLIFMDIGLPEKNGWEASLEMRQWENVSNRQHTPIIALTAHIDQSNRQQCLDSGMDLVLTKPLTSENIQSITNILKEQKTELPAVEKNTEVTNDPLKSIDLELGAQIVGGNRASAKEMLKIFIDTIPEIEINLVASYNKRDWEQLQFWVHKLHGGACYCGVPQLKAIAKDVEDNLKLNNIDLAIHGYKSLIIEISNVLKEYNQI